MCVCVFVCVGACVKHACVRVCFCACVRACMCACARASTVFLRLSSSFAVPLCKCSCMLLFVVFCYFVVVRFQY